MMISKAMEANFAYQGICLHSLNHWNNSGHSQEHYVVRGSTTICYIFQFNGLD